MDSRSSDAPVFSDEITRRLAHSMPAAPPEGTGAAGGNATAASTPQEPGGGAAAVPGSRTPGGGRPAGTAVGPAPEDALPHTAAAAVKIVIVGGFGVGKTTMVGSVSEIRPLTTEETMTTAGVGVDDLEGMEHKTETTVAMDFGRISINDQLVLYLFGTPGQERFWFLWNGLFEGALGAVVLVDTRRLEVSFDVLGRLEERGVPFVVAVNKFPQSPQYDERDLRAALDLPPMVPILEVDARVRTSSRDILLALTRYLRYLATTTDHPYRERA